MSMSRRMCLEAIEALKSDGLDVSGYVRLLGKMAMGFREIGIKDRIRLAGKPPKRYTPRMGVIVDEDTGDKRTVILIDELTQFRALKVVGEMMGLLQAGGLHVNVGIGDGNAVGDRASIASEVGNQVVMLRGSGVTALEEAVRALPAPERRRLALAAVRNIQEGAEHARDHDSPGREPNALSA